MKYGFVQEQASDYPVKLLCRMLDVQRSAYYEWRDRPCRVIAPEELALRRRLSPTDERPAPRNSVADAASTAHSATPTPPTIPWLIIEWPTDSDEPAHYWFSKLPANTPWQPMIDTVMGRWRIERDYEELKQELGWAT